MLYLPLKAGTKTSKYSKRVAPTFEISNGSSVIQFGVNAHLIGACQMRIWFCAGAHRICAGAHPNLADAHPIEAYFRKEKETIA